MPFKKASWSISGLIPILLPSPPDGGCKSGNICEREMSFSGYPKREEFGFFFCGRRQTGEIWPSFCRAAGSELVGVGTRWEDQGGRVAIWQLLKDRAARGPRRSWHPDLCYCHGRLCEVKRVLYKATPNFSLACFSLNKKTNQEKQPKIPKLDLSSLSSVAKCGWTQTK